MPEINVNVNHQLGQKEAFQRVQGLLTKLKTDFAGLITDLQEEWLENAGNFSCNAMGNSFKGKFIVSDNDVQINGNIPMSALFFKGIIEQKIREKAEEILS